MVEQICDEHSRTPTENCRIVRRGTPADVELMERRNRADRWFPLEQWDGHKAYVMANFADGTGKGILLVACENDTLVGRVFVDTWSKSKEALGVIQDLFVVSRCRSAGIGSDLIRHAENVICEEGLTSAEIAAEINNPRAKRLYERFGYLVVGPPREQLVEWRDKVIQRHPVAHVMHKIVGV